MSSNATHNIFSFPAKSPVTKWEDNPKLQHFTELSCSTSFTRFRFGESSSKICKIPFPFVLDPTAMNFAVDGIHLTSKTEKSRLCWMWATVWTWTIVRSSLKFTTSFKSLPRCSTSKVHLLMRQFSFIIVVLFCCCLDSLLSNTEKPRYEFHSKYTEWAQWLGVYGIYNKVFSMGVLRFFIKIDCKFKKKMQYQSVEDCSSTRGNLVKF